MQGDGADLMGNKTSVALSVGYGEADTDAGIADMWAMGMMQRHGDG